MDLVIWVFVIKWHQGDDDARFLVLTNEIDWCYFILFLDALASQDLTLVSQSASRNFEFKIDLKYKSIILNSCQLVIMSSCPEFLLAGHHVSLLSCQHVNMSSSHLVILFFVNVWYFLTTFGNILQLLESFGNFWRLLASFACFFAIFFFFNCHHVSLQSWGLS